jgi:hypothetical protein
LSLKEGLAKFALISTHQFEKFGIGFYFEF